jgi:hypothetical protein
MNTKLTLSIDKNIIEKAKKYAKNRHKSVSKLIENYLKNIVVKNDYEKISPIVNELAGSIKNNKINLKEDYTEYLIKKYK